MIFITNENSYYVNYSNDLLKVIKSLSGQILSSELVNPVGSLIMGPIPEANCPDGYLLCNGQEVSRTRYAQLFTLLGTNFGSGDGSTTFNIPDYRGCFLRMLSTDTNENTNMYAKQNSGVPNITGSLQQWGVLYNFTGCLTGNDFGPDGTGYAGSGSRSNLYFDASNSSSVYQSITEVRPTNYSINYFIKY